MDSFSGRRVTTLIRTSLAENYDVRIAAARILQAQAALGITGLISSQRLQQELPPPVSAFRKRLWAGGKYKLERGESLALWELDFWASSAGPPRRHEQTFWQQNGDNGP